MAGLTSTIVTLFVLTAMPGEQMAGKHSTAYTNKADMATCEASVGPVTDILTNGGVKVVSIECLKTSQPITQFKHRPPKDAPRHAYLNRISDGQLMLLPQESEEACLKAYETGGTGKVRHICSTSKQQLVE